MPNTNSPRAHSAAVLVQGGCLSPKQRGIQTSYGNYM